MNKNKFLISSILLFLAILSPVFVKADSVSYTSVGYGYTQSEHGISLTWNTYNTNNLVKYNYDLPNSDYIEITEFDLRFSLGSGNQFKKGYNYVLSFYWFNDYDNSTFSVYYGRMIHSLSCRKDNWNTTNQYGTDCFISESIEIEQDTSINGLIRVNLRFTPIKDFFGLTMQNKHDNVIYENYLSEGWEVYNISYLVVEDGTQSIINNQNQNTQNIINNQDSNTQDIIDNQNQNAQDIQDTINNNLQSCRNSYNLFNSTTGTTTRAGITFTKNSDGTYTANGTATNNIFFQIGTYTFVSGTSLYLSGSTGGSNSTYFLQINASPYTTNTSGYSAVGSTASGNKPIIIYVANGTHMNNVVFKPMLSVDRVPYEKYGEQVCQSKLDDTNNAINNLNDSINDTSAPDTSGLSNATGWLPPGPVDSILNLPLTLLQSLNNAFSSNSCQAISVNLPYVNTPLTIPCMSTVWEGFGLLPLFTWIGRVLGGVLLYKYLIGLYKWVDDTLTMRENNNFDDGSLG